MSDRSATSFSGAALGRTSGMRHRLVMTAAISLALAVPAIWASAADAAFHLMKVREVHAGSTAAPDAQYVQLQAYARGQHLVRGHSVRTYGPSGEQTGTNTFGSNIGDGRNQMTILLATPEAEAELGISADSPMGPGQLSREGGAVCFESIDCVAWGSFDGSLPSPAGDPAEPGGIPDGRALRRTIEPNCPTLLEAADDRNDSNRDFFPASPDPRPSSVAPSESPCRGPGGSQPGQNGERPASGTLFAAPTALARGSAGLIRVLCRGRQGASCRGVLRLVVRVPSETGYRTRIRNVVIGGARYNHPAGRTVRRIRFGLNRTGARLVQGSAPRGLRVILVGSGLRNRAIRLREVG